MTTAFSPALAVLETDDFNPTDRHLASLLLRLSGKDCPALGLAAALVSRQLADGHSCISLDAFSSGAPISGPPRQEWEKLLLDTSVVGRPGDDKPLILDQSGRLYLHRYWRYNSISVFQARHFLQNDGLGRKTAGIERSVINCFQHAPGAL